MYTTICKWSVYVLMLLVISRSSVFAYNKQHCADCLQKFRVLANIPTTSFFNILLFFTCQATKINHQNIACSFICLVVYAVRFREKYCQLNCCFFSTMTYYELTFNNLKQVDIRMRDCQLCMVKSELKTNAMK